eukprot:CAMPEP_0174380560 /NCGR_PEP_ID=MMETSP0811_2-20130205/123455_1 /TAXON_ID=73025 ORGANISM="Eutreptiella gymnastica-like, Strain CCMP1594" /NCGR_SAMPLE_ID=MMETSP0811_2 /ASSEMBLY_ACC=CAM_ASM_000667 /LENGTH=65 /DNA_ID=CAMNT_0015533467 /DNA_START=1029 /DNA_END=1225 /DNA_ORIENTATION=-
MCMARTHEGQQHQQQQQQQQTFAGVATMCMARTHEGQQHQQQQQQQQQQIQKFKSPGTARLFPTN